MPRNIPRTNATLLGLAVTTFLGMAPMRIAGQAVTQAPALSQQESRKVGQPEEAKGKAKPKAKVGRSVKGRVRRDPPGVYRGRPIADVMSWEGVDWLFRETRIEEEQPESMLNALKIPRGATVADVGAGAGYHSIRL